MPAQETADAFAAAKINLALHVVGQRADGYHRLDSLVAFVGVGDRLSLRRAAVPSLTVGGPMAAGVPVDGGNLVLRAAGLFDPPVPAAIVLQKRLPAAAGIGGGSSDAAACVVALAHLSGQPLPPIAALVRLGADVPVCLSHAPRRMRGIGEVLDPVPALPPLWAVLVNPGKPVPTPQVFAALGKRDNTPLPDGLPAFDDAAAFCGWLSAQRNDLQPPALAVLPDIADCLTAVSATPGCLLARMSGSGATCFGLYASAAGAMAARSDLAQRQAGWWCAAGPLLAGGDPLSEAPA